MQEVKNYLPKRANLLYPIEEYFNDFFDSFFHNKNLPSIKSRSNYPKMDVYRDKDTWNVEVAVPGVKTEDISVEIFPGQNHENLLKISGRMSSEYSREEAEYSVKELRKSFFERTLPLPLYVNGEPKATVKDGILKLTWKTLENEKIDTKKIAIESL